MLPFGFALGALAGAAAVILFLGPQLAQRGRPVAKAMLKGALAALHEAQVRGTEIAEAAEDLYAEAKSEVTAEVFTAAMAAAKAKAAEQAAAKAQPRPNCPRGRLASELR
jgi:hypothetical protein